MEPQDQQFPENPTYDKSLSAIVSDNSGDLAFNFYFGDLHSNLETHHLAMQEIIVPKGRAIKRVLMYYKESSGLLYGFLMYDANKKLIVEAPANGQEELEDNYAS